MTIKSQQHRGTSQIDTWLPRFPSLSTSHFWRSQWLLPFVIQWYFALNILKENRDWELQMSAYMKILLKINKGEKSFSETATRWQKPTKTRNTLSDAPGNFLL